MERKIQVWRIIFIAIAITSIFLFSSNYTLGAEIKIKAGRGYSAAFKSNGDVYVWGIGPNNTQPFGLGKVELLNPSKIENLKDFTDIFLEESSSGILALKNDGTVWLWSGSLYGLSDTEDIKANQYPYKIKRLKNIIAIAHGGDILFLKANGTVWQWGNGGDFSSFRQVPGLKNIQTITAGQGHYLAIEKGGTVWAWGHNSHGQLSGIPGAHLDDPAQIKQLNNIIAVAAGENHSLALKADGTVWAWGNNEYGQLGCGTKEPLQGIQKVKIIQNIVAIAAGGNYNITLQSDGTIWKWGKNYYLPKDKEESVPVQIAGLTKIKSIAASAYHSLALKEDGSLWAWGNNGYGGQLGNGTKDQHHLSVKVKGLKNAIALSAEGSRSYALTSDGKVWEWGDVGSSQEDYYNMPRPVVGLNDITKITAAAHYKYNIALKSDKTVWIWGYYYKHEVENSIKIHPFQVEGLNDIVDITRGNVALKSDGTVWYWKCKKLGRIDNIEPKEPNIVERVADLSDITSIEANPSLALKKDGTVWLWHPLEENTRLKESVIPLGAGAIAVEKAPLIYPRDFVPKKISNLNNVKAIDGHGNYCLALKSDGTVWTWRISRSRLWAQRLTGYEKIYEEAPGWDVPKKIPLLSDIIAISANNDNGLALKRDGTVWGWKWSNYNKDRSGNFLPTVVHFTEPTQIDNLIDIAAIAAGNGHFLVLKKDGTVWGWGSNFYGQLGTGGNIHQYTPIQITGEGSIGYFIVN